jgi:hypothetical protein
MPRAIARLRWQLTISHLVAIAFTLLSMIAAIAFLASAWFGSAGRLCPSTRRAAQVVAQVLTGRGRGRHPKT